MKINKLATHIVFKLQQEGYVAYFAGGWVRDYVMNHPSSDVDIATNAPPQVILDLFPKTILVGLSFGVIIVVLEGHQFEVSTFRKDFEYESGRRPSRIEFATAEEDASRRDFTINGMFYDPLTEKIYDYVGGLEDLEKKVIRTIGNPFDRFYEDRLRMIRALRFAGRFGFHIEVQTQEAIAENAETLFPAVAMERVWQEFEKMAQFPHFDWVLLEMHRLKLLQVIFPQFKNVHLHDLKKQVASFEYFPPSTPTILYLNQLFQGYADLNEMKEIVQYLKASRRNQDFLEMFGEAKRLFFQDQPDVEWAYFLSKTEAGMVTEAVLAPYSLPIRTQILDHVQKKRRLLARHIERLEQKAPLIRSADLIAAGIPPGPKMGILLKVAEEIAINQNLEDKENVLTILKQSNYW